MLKPLIKFSNSLNKKNNLNLNSFINTSKEKQVHYVKSLNKDKENVQNNQNNNSNNIIITKKIPTIKKKFIKSGLNNIMIKNGNLKYKKLNYCSNNTGNTSNHSNKSINLINQI